MDTKETVIKIISTVCEVAENEVCETTAIGDFPAWDSMGHISTLSKVEEAFDINFEPEEMMDIEDVSDIIKAVESKK